MKINPIREALLAIYFKEKISDIEILENISNEFLTDFPVRNLSQIISHNFTFKEHDASAQKPEKTTDGFIHSNTNSKLTIQLKTDRIVVNKLKPYNNWEELESTLKLLCEKSPKII